MDALALLCTLHADGPTTLARLRQAECISLEHVIAHPTERVARWMRVSVVSAERFQREARGLYERLGPELQSRVDDADEREVHEEREGDRDAGFDRERARAMSLAARGHDAHADAHGHDARSDDARATSRGRGDSKLANSAAAKAPLAPLSASGTSERDPILQRVLDTWRERDELDAMTDSDVDDVPAALPTPAAELPAIGTQWIDGLDAEASAALSRAGIGTIAALASCEALGVARATGMPFSKVLRLRALARRSGFTDLPRADTMRTDLVQAAQSAQAKVSPSERPFEPRSAVFAPPAEPERSASDSTEPDFVLEPSRRDEGVGGPFA